MKNLLKYLKHYSKESIIAPLFKMLEASFELFIPIVMAEIIDVGIKNTDQPYIWKMCVVMVFLGVLGLICSLTAQYFAAKAAWGFGTELRKDMYDHIHALSYTELDMAGTPTLVNRMTSDIMQVQTGVNMALRLFLRSPFLVVGAVCMAFTISRKLTIVFLAAVLGIGLVLYLITRVTIPLYGNIQKILDKIVLLTRENYVGARVVRAFSREKVEQKEFFQVNEHMEETQMHAGNIAALMNPLTFVLVNLAIVVILWAGGHQVQEGSLSQGQIVALVNYMSQILLALTALANLMLIFTRAAACAGRVNEVFELKPSMKNGTQEADKRKKQGYEVAFEHVTFSYQKAQEPSLSDITFSVEKGQTIGVIGATGSGKSTLLQLIGRFYDCQQGKVSVDGLDVREYRMDALRNKIGMVPQKAMLFKGTIRSNLLWGKPEAQNEELWKALEIAQARQIVENKNGKLDSEVEMYGRNFSGGQRQRITIARALVRKPEILILDDSTSALDYATDEAFRSALHANKGEMTVFAASQRAAAVRHADRILVLDDGKLVGNGTHEELLKTCEVYREICRSQFSGEEGEG